MSYSEACRFGHFVEAVLYFMFNCEKVAADKLAGTTPTAALSSFKYREESFTEVIVSLANRKFPKVDFRAFSVPRESSVSGADLLLIIRTPTQILRLLIQAKRPDTAILKMAGPWTFDLGSATPVGKLVSHYAKQRNLLLTHAPTLRAVPVYAFYCPDKSQSSCDQKPPSFDADFGTLHIVEVISITSPIYAPGTPFPGVTVANLLCCGDLTDTLGTPLGDEDISEDQLFRVISELAEIGQAPANIVLVDFTKVSDE